jgi:hypothetical protein
MPHISNSGPERTKGQRQWSPTHCDKDFGATVRLVIVVTCSSEAADLAEVQRLKAGCLFPWADRACPLYGACATGKRVSFQTSRQWLQADEMNDALDRALVNNS